MNDEDGQQPLEKKYKLYYSGNLKIPYNTRKRKIQLMKKRFQDRDSDRQSLHSTIEADSSSSDESNANELTNEEGDERDAFIQEEHHSSTPDSDCNDDDNEALEIENRDVISDSDTPTNSGSSRSNVVIGTGDSSNEGSGLEDSENESIQEEENEEVISVESDEDDQEYIGDSRHESSDDETFDVEYLNAFISNGSTVKVGEVVLFLEHFAARHNVSNKAYDDLLRFIRILMPNRLPRSVYMLQNVFSEVLDVIIYHLYCHQCGQYLVGGRRYEMTNNELTCDICNEQRRKNLTDGNFFVTFEIKEQLKILLEDPIVSRALAESVDSRTTVNLKIKDIYDGQIYAHLKRVGGKLFNPYNLSLNFTVDGASVFVCSRSSCWPIQMILNELPPKLRFQKIIVAGLWFGSEGPSMDVSLKPFQETLCNLEIEGVSWIDHSGILRRSKIIPLLCCVDTVARQEVMNCVQFNGKYGCPWCYHPGQVMKKTLKYPFSMPEIIEDPRDVGTDGYYKCRSEENVRNEMRKAYDNNEVTKGFRGPTPLYNLPSFNVLWGFPIDYLHSVLLGVVGRTLFDLWFSSDAHEMYYIGSPFKITQINKRLLAIRPPRMLHRLPQAIGQRALWKASEFKAFLLYYGIPCLINILPANYLQHFALLVEGITLLLQSEISLTELDKSYTHLKNFVAQFDNLYGKQNMTYNVHLLLHIPKTVRMCGPLWTFSTFPYESHMLRLKNCVKSSKGVAMQIAEKVAKRHSLSLLLKKVEVSMPVASSLQKLSNTHSLQSGRLIGGDCFILDHGKLTELCDEERVLLRRKGWQDNVSIVEHTRMTSKGIMFSVASYTRARKRNNSIIRLTDGSFAKLENIIVLDNNHCELFVKKLKTTLFRSGGIVFTNLMIVEEIDQIALLSLRDVVTTCVFMENRREKYVATPLATFEIQ